MPKITFTFKEINQPSPTALMDFNQHVHQLLSNPMYYQAKKGHNFAEVTHSTQKRATS